MRRVTYSIAQWAVIVRFGLIRQGESGYATLAYRLHTMADDEALTLPLDNVTVERIRAMLGAKSGL